MNNHSYINYSPYILLTYININLNFSKSQLKKNKNTKINKKKIKLI